MSEHLSCGGLHELALEAQELFASLKGGSLTDGVLPEGFKSPVGLLQFAVALRVSSVALDKPCKIHAADPELHRIAAECGLTGVLEPLAANAGGAHV